MSSRPTIAPEQAEMLAQAEVSIEMSLSLVVLKSALCNLDVRVSKPLALYRM